MAGLYIHIPFCKQACHYCNFHFSTSLKLKEKLLQAIHEELDQRHHYLDSKALQSIYLGGGTPSLLSMREITHLFEVISQYFDWSEECEITLESNPDDLSPEKVRDLFNSPINRLSIGIQSFDDGELQYMNRSHDASTAHECLKSVKNIGFENVTVDLIYGSEKSSPEIWMNNLQQLLVYDIDHFSAYALTVEPRTALASQIEKGGASAPLEEVVIESFRYTQQFAIDHDFFHYEISNFARKGLLAVHNTNYWRRQPYLGVGPSAHSFNGSCRGWNIANNMQYISLVNSGSHYHTVEKLSIPDYYNEYVMTSLRTAWGCDLEEITSISSECTTYFLKEVDDLLVRGLVERSHNVYKLTSDGKLFADQVASQLFMVE